MRPRLFSCFFDGQCLGRTGDHGPLDFVAGLVWRLDIEDFDLAALGHPEIVGRLQFAHRMSLAQVQVGLHSITHITLRSTGAGSALWRAGPAAPPSWSGRCDSFPAAAPSQTRTRATEPRRSL